jgi:hypothetical protein
MINLRSFCFALALCAVAVPARADEASHAAALDLVKLVMPPEVYDSTINQMADQMFASLSQGGKAIPAGMVEKLKAAVKECLPYDEQLSWSADVYSKYFTQKELGEMVSFYKTPTGKKMAKLLPNLMGEVGKKMGPILQQRMPAALKKHGIQ